MSPRARPRPARRAGGGGGRRGGSAPPVLVPLRTLLALVAALPFVALGACADADGRPVDGAGLIHAHRSPEALARAVVDGVAANDREALERLLVTREEHRELLWRQLPESGYMSFGDALSLNERNTDEALRDLLRTHGGTRFELVGISFAGEPEVYDEFTLHRGARLRVREKESGRVGLLPVLDVVLERGGLWKPMHYVE